MTAESDAVVRRVYDYAFALDQRDWSLYRSIFTEELTADFSSYNGRPRSVMSADDWVAGVKPLFTGLDATQHSMSNPVVDIEGDRAQCRMYMQAAHFLGQGVDAVEFTIGGYYQDRLTRIDGDWLIDAVTLVVWWRRGDPGIMVTATELGASWLAGNA